MKCEFYKYSGIILLLFLPVSAMLAQPTKLRMASPDSVLSRFIDRGFLKGTVSVEQSDVPIAGGAVTLSDQPVDSTIDSTEFIVRNQTDSTGFFSFDLIPEGQYYLEVNYPGYFSYTESVWIDGQRLSTLDIQLVPDYSHPSLHKSGSVQFEITDKSTGEPIDGASIHFVELQKYVETDPSGIRYVHLLAPGSYHFSISSDGYRDRTGDSVVVAAGACTTYTGELRELVVSRGDLLCREEHHRAYPVTMIDPNSFCTLTGGVINLDAREYVPYEHVFLAPFGIVADTDSTGTFTFRGLRSGFYCATVRIPGFYRTTEHEIYLPPGRAVRVNIFIRELPYAD